MANDFSDDISCKALWRFESGALTVDSKGGNTLTDHNTVSENTSEYKEGAACADFERSNGEYFSIADSDLDSEFPLKNGDTVKEISVSFWFRAESLTESSMGLFSKSDSNKYSFLVYLHTSGALLLYLGYSGGSAHEMLQLATGLTYDKWYHVGITYKDSTKTWTCRIYDATSDSASSSSGTATNNINIEDSALQIGAWRGISHFDGEIDEVIVFSDIKSADDFDAIRAGTYSGGSGVLPIKLLNAAQPTRIIQ